MREAPFKAEVRLKGDKAWKPLFVYHADSMSKLSHAYGGAEGFVKCAFDGETEFRVTFPVPVRQTKLRPSLREPVPAVFEGNSVRFRLERPRYMTLEVNRLPGVKDVPRFTLYILADAPETAPPSPDAADVKVLAPGRHKAEEFDPGDRKVLYLSDGMHTVEGDLAGLYSGKALYIAGGAVLRAKIIGDNVSDAKLLGHGIIDGSTIPRVPGDWRSEGTQGFIFLRRGDGITMDGPVIYNCPYWNIVPFGTTNLVIRNHKAITWTLNNDGVQPRSCTDLLVEHCFLKCADDCIAIKTRRAAAMESRRLMFRDLVLWNDVPGNPMEIGHTSQADLLEDVTFCDIDVIHAEGPKHHTISMCIIDHSTVRNVLYENIYVEGIRQKDIGLRVTTSRYTTDKQHGRIQGVTIRNYLMDGKFHGGEVTGFDDQHMVEDVSIENIVNFFDDPGRSQKVKSLKDLGLTIRHAENIRYRP